MAEIVEHRWKRFGHDRVYLETVSGEALGHVDLKASSFVATDPAHDEVLATCLARWSADAAQQYTDLAMNEPGAAATAAAEDVAGSDAEAPWRIGAHGEKKVARRLERLGQGWHVLHAVKVGRREADIDHLVIGPPGVVTINTKTHLDGHLWLGEFAIYVNHHKQHYLPHARHEAERASRLLTSATGISIEATPMIVFVGLAGATVKQHPSDVIVSIGNQVVERLKRLPVMLEPTVVDEIYEVARRSTTWTPS